MGGVVCKLGTEQKILLKLKSRLITDIVLEWQYWCCIVGKKSIRDEENRGTWLLLGSTVKVFLLHLALMGRSLGF